MNLTNLNLRSFRNYEEVHLEFEPGVNLIVGDNAQGKTNLLEAVYYLGSGKSFRTQKAAELVRDGDVIMMDASSSAYAIIPYLTQKKQHYRHYERHQITHATRRMRN